MYSSRKEILNELKRRKYLTTEEENEALDLLKTSTSDVDQEIDDTDSHSDSDSDKLEEKITDQQYYDIINETIKILVEDDVRKLSNLLDRDVVKLAKDYLDEKKAIGDVFREIEKDGKLDRLMKAEAEMYLNNMLRTKNKVQMVLKSLRSNPEMDVERKLTPFQLRKWISNPEYQRLLASPNDMKSYARALIGDVKSKI